MRDFRSTTLVSTPTVALGLARAMDEMGLDANSLALKCGIFGSEPWSEATRDDLETRLHVTATDTFGLTEIFGPGVAWECPEKNGLHISEDHFIPEVIDPETLEPLPPGEEGELVLTTIAREAFPLIRLRTGDLTRIDYRPCACGRTHCRISRIFKRSDEVIRVRGTSITPEQVGQAIARVSGGQPNFQLVITREADADQLLVMVEISDINFFDEMKKQRRFVERLHREISEALGWEVAVRLVEPGTFDPQKRVRDERQFT